MKTLVAYYSKSGTNRKIAQEVKERLGCDIEEIVDEVNRSGFFAFFKAGRQAMSKSLTKIAPLSKDVKDYGLVVVVAPIWAGRLPPAARTFMSENKEKLDEVAFLSVSGGGDGNKSALADVESELGRKLVASLLLNKKEFKEGGYSKKLEDFLSGLSSKKAKN